MIFRSSFVRVSASALAAAMLAFPPAAAADTYETCTGTITALPAVITTQGTWCLAGDLGTGLGSGDAVTIGTNNDTLDCNGYKMGGLAAGTGTLAIGIHAEDHLNATVRNCSIRGFHQGIVFEGTGSGGHAIEDNRFDGNPFTALVVEGDGSVIRRNRIADTGRSTAGGPAIGIRTAYSVDIIDNTVTGVYATSGSDGDAHGIVIVDNPDGQIDGNRVRRIVGNGTGVAFGIHSSTSGRISLRDNELVGDGTTGSTGLFCDPGSEAITLDNAVSHFDTANSDCGDDGGNIEMP